MLGVRLDALLGLSLMALGEHLDLLSGLPLVWRLALV